MSAALLQERWVGDENVPRYELESWRREHGIVAGITGRDGGFDLGLYGRDPVGEVLDRWNKLQDSVGPGISGVAANHQVHATEIVSHDHPFDGLKLQHDFDGHVTCVAGVVLAVTVADCVPVYMAHPASGCVGLVHAGWQGTASGIVENGIDHLCAVADAPASELIMHCGVSICGRCYEVGPEVHERVSGRVVHSPKPIDLRENLVERARRCGIVDVSVSVWCSAHDDDRFYSHRASGGADGRMAAYVGHPTT